MRKKIFNSRNKPCMRAKAKGVKKVMASVEHYTELADLIGVTKQQVYSWKNKGEIPLKFVADVSDATGVPRNEIHPNHY